MDYFQLSENSQQVSRICMGGSSPIGSLFTNHETADKFEAALKRSYELGINFFDSAEAYGNGISERILGKVVAPIREKVILASKVAWEHSHPSDLRNACEESLRRLNTPYLDIYYLHYPNREVPIGETMSTLMELKSEGKIRSIGVSNFSLEQLQAAQRYGDVDVVQQCYSLLWRSYPEKYLFPYCVTHGIKVVAYGSLASGLLSGKFKRNENFESSDQRARTSSSDGLLLYLPEWWNKSLEVVEHFGRITESYSATLAQIAIKWVLMQDSVDAVIIGGKDPAQVEENAGSMQIDLKSEVVRAMDYLSRQYTSMLPEYVNYYLKMKNVWNEDRN